jgi:hypothetical protein
MSGMGMQEFVDQHVDRPERSVHCGARSGIGVAVRPTHYECLHKDDHGCYQELWWILDPSWCGSTQRCAVRPQFASRLASRGSVHPLCENEPPWGVEPQTYALRGWRSVPLSALPAPTAPPTAPRTLGVLGERDPSCQNSCQRSRSKIDRYEVVSDASGRRRSGWDRPYTPAPAGAWHDREPGQCTRQRRPVRAPDPTALVRH